MTVDVEDYFQVSAFENRIERSSWEGLPSRVVANTERILRVFDEAGTKATFFILGWVAERHPDLVRRIADAGHEVASHGYSHVRITEQSPEEFSRDVVRTKGLLEDCTGRSVAGYRAASFSIVERNLWALDILAECGHLYSSSIYPIRHDLYGIPGAPRHAFHVDGKEILEIPITTLKLFNRNLPAGGGGYFRLFPYPLSKWAIGRVNRSEGRPAIFYFHPWELDPGQPRQTGISLKTRFRHYVNLGRMEGRLRRLLSDFDWDRVDNIFLGT